jgi:glycosyltransferase involved in cell wall biosynthesis
MLLSLLLTITPIIKIYNVKCIYHVHDTSLKKELSGVIGKVVRRLYINCVSLTIIPNITLLQYSLLHPAINVEYLVNPFIGRIHYDEGERKDSYCFISFPSKNKNLDLAINLIQVHGKKLEVIGWSESDAKLLYPNLNIDSTRITFLGKVDHDKAMKRLSGSLGLISVSNREAMPLTIIEALIRKVPVYVENHTGYRYFIDNFTSVKSIHDLENANKDYNDRSVTESYEKAKMLFSIRLYNSKLINLFK